MNGKKGCEQCRETDNAVRFARFEDILKYLNPKVYSQYTNLTITQSGQVSASRPSKPPVET